MKKEILITLLCAGLMLVTPLGVVARENTISSNLLEQPDIEPKDYLFQTIIDIANNPDVKELLEQYDTDLFKLDIDKSFYRKILLRNPRLFLNTLLSKSSISVEYLNKCYNEGVELIDIYGIDSVYEIIQKSTVNKQEIFEELSAIISNNEVLNYNIENLVSITKEIEQNHPLSFYSTECFIMMALLFFVVFIASPFGLIVNILFGIPYMILKLEIIKVIGEIICYPVNLLIAILFIGVIIACFSGYDEQINFSKDCPCLQE